MATTVKQWEGAWARLIQTRDKLKSFESGHAIVRHLLILDNTQPGGTINLEHGFAESGFAEPPPPMEVLKAIEDFNKALRREDGVFRQLRMSDKTAVAARRNFE